VEVLNMIYFKENDDVIEKYLVNFDKEEIEKLKKKIIDDCSFIKHKEYKSDSSPRFDDKFIKNFECLPTEEKKEYFEETKEIYQYSYDEYIPPYLVELIDELLNGNSKVIDKILNYDISTKSTIDDKINLVNQEFIKMPPEDITKRKLKLKELEDLLKEKELNEGQQSIKSYYEKLIELIRFDIVDLISISELSRIESFLEINLANKIINSNSKDKPYTKELKKVD
jgi:hypothetical protein